MNIFSKILSSTQGGIDLYNKTMEGVGSNVYDWANNKQDPIQRFLEDKNIDNSKKSALMQDINAGKPKDLISEYISKKYYKEPEFRETIPTAPTLFPSTGQENPIVGSAKMIGNIPGSLWNLGAGAINLGSTAIQEGVGNTASMVGKGIIRGIGEGAENISNAYQKGGIIGGANQLIEGAQKAVINDPSMFLAPQIFKGAGKLINTGGEKVVLGISKIPQQVSKTTSDIIQVPKKIVRSGVDTLEKIKPGIKDTLVDIDPQSRYAVERSSPKEVSKIIEDAKMAKLDPRADYQQTPYHKGAEMANKTIDTIDKNLKKRQSERMSILENAPLEKVDLNYSRNILKSELDKLNIENIAIDESGKPVVIPKKGRSALLDQNNPQDMKAIEKLGEILRDDVSPLQTMDNIKILQEWLYENKGTIALKGISKKMEGIVSKVQSSLNKTFKDQLPPEYRKVMDSMSEDMQMSQDIKRLFGIGDDGMPVGNKGELIMKRLTNGTTTGGEARILAEKILKKYGIDLIKEARLRQLSMELVGDTRGANLFGAVLSGKKGMMDWAMGKVGDTLIDKESLIKSYAGKGKIVKPKKQPNLYTKPKKDVGISSNSDTSTNTQGSKKINTPLNFRSSK